MDQHRQRPPTGGPVDNPAPLPPGWATLPFGGPSSRGAGVRRARGDPRPGPGSGRAPLPIGEHWH
jgi:hypothetical protein